MAKRHKRHIGGKRTATQYNLSNTISVSIALRALSLSLAYENLLATHAHIDISTPVNCSALFMFAVNNRKLFTQFLYVCTCTHWTWCTRRQMSFFSDNKYSLHKERERGKKLSEILCSKSESPSTCDHMFLKFTQHRLEHSLKCIQNELRKQRSHQKTTLRTISIRSSKQFISYDVDVLTFTHTNTKKYLISASVRGKNDFLFSFYALPLI